jgi:hypothetical protein
VLGSPSEEPKVLARTIMLLRSLARGGSCPGSPACLTLYRPRGAASPRPTSRPPCHPEIPLPPAFFAALREATSPTGCSFADFATARAGKPSNTGSLQSRPAPRSSINYPARDSGAFIGPEFWCSAVCQFFWMYSFRIKTTGKFSPFENGVTGQFPLTRRWLCGVTWIL